MSINLAQAVVVFDLDDTLYFEADYVDSGVQHVCDFLKRIYCVDVYSVVQAARLEHKQLDWLHFACEQAGLPVSVKETLLWIYRMHPPHIRLSEECTSALKIIKAKASAVAVLTDGRSVTQRLKLQALGLTDWPVYISEEFGAPKPAPNRFNAIQTHFPAKQYIYVADNVAKDFLGCNPLGWIGIGMKGSERNVHSPATIHTPESALPAYWVSSWDELLKLLDGSDDLLLRHSPDQRALQP